jgi:hypothetical protein
MKQLKMHIEAFVIGSLINASFFGLVLFATNIVGSEIFVLSGLILTMLFVAYSAGRLFLLYFGSKNDR